MAGLSIPGVTDQYKTNDTVEKLMKIERIPLTREQETLDDYKAQKDAWRDVNRLLASLRDSTKTLYSFENPFNNKLTTSTEENAITAEANRSASVQDFKVDVIQPATADRFLSSELDKDYKVPAGMYTFKVGEKQLTFNWKGGSLKDFSDAVNKRGKNVVKTLIVGASAGKKTLLLEGLATGKENNILFEGAAKDFAESIGMISPVKSKTEIFAKNITDAKQVPSRDFNEQSSLPVLSTKNIKYTDNNYELPPRSGAMFNIPDKIKNTPTSIVSFSIKTSETNDITEEINNRSIAPQIPDSGSAFFAGIEIDNEKSETLLKTPERPPETLNPVSSDEYVFAVMEDGSEKLLKPSKSENGVLSYELTMRDYDNIKSIAVRNRNTGVSVSLSSMESWDSAIKAGYKPNNAISTADDAIIKYEGIKISRPTNDIDDIVPEITLHVHEKTEKTATLSVKPDVESSKEALISFVGKYNQAVAELNILTQNKEELLSELDYLSQDEIDAEKKKLGMFLSDFSLTNIKSNMANVISSNYQFSDGAKITHLAQIGIATNAAGFGSGYNATKLRGYLEIDEKKLDDALENHLDDIKNMFGYDSDGDLIIDSGIAYNMDKQITAYTQTGGILAMKTSALDSKIKTSERKIATLETKLADTEANLRYKYGQMEGSLNSLENQQNTISNFTKQNNRN